MLCGSLDFVTPLGAFYEVQFYHEDEQQGVAEVGEGRQGQGNPDWVTLKQGGYFVFSASRKP